MTEKSCSRCGECCRVLPLPISGMSPEILAYYRCRGLKEDQGFILVPHDCQHLRQFNRDHSEMRVPCIQTAQ